MNLWKVNYTPHWGHHDDARIGYVITREPSIVAVKDVLIKEHFGLNPSANVTIHEATWLTPNVLYIPTDFLK